jgi:hypothetical protein
MYYKKARMPSMPEYLLFETFLQGQKRATRTEVKK